MILNTKIIQAYDNIMQNLYDRNIIMQTKKVFVNIQHIIEA